MVAMLDKATKRAMLPVSGVGPDGIRRKCRWSHQGQHGRRAWGL